MKLLACLIICNIGLWGQLRVGQPFPPPARPGAAQLASCLIYMERVGKKEPV